MVYRFKLVSDEVTNFCREIEIDASDSFLQLRNVILESVGYSKEDMSSFFLCDDDWERREEITLEDMGGGSSDRDLWIMEDTPLDELIEEEGQKLSFVFDYMTERSFFLELKEEKVGSHLSAPICTMKRGNPPAQRVDLDEFMGRIDEAARQTAGRDPLDTDVEFYGTSDYDPDELPEGYDDEMG